MSPYQVNVPQKVKKTLAKLPRLIQNRVEEWLIKLSHTPRPPQAVALQGQTNTYRIRLGDYRLIYDVFDEACVVLVVKLGHRREVYRD